MDTAESIIRAYIAENMLFSSEYPYSDDASFLDEGVVDSMNVMELVTFISDRFGIVVQDGEIVPDNFDSVRNLSDYVRRKADSRATFETSLPPLRTVSIAEA